MERSATRYGAVKFAEVRRDPAALLKRAARCNKPETRPFELPSAAHSRPSAMASPQLRRSFQRASSPAPHSPSPSDLGDGPDVITAVGDLFAEYAARRGGGTPISKPGERSALTSAPGSAARYNDESQCHLHVASAGCNCRCRCRRSSPHQPDGNRSTQAAPCRPSPTGRGPHRRTSMYPRTSASSTSYGSARSASSVHGARSSLTSKRRQRACRPTRGSPRCTSPSRRG